MMADDDFTRLSHIIRIFGTNKNEDVLQDVYLDIDRTDVMRTTEQARDGHWQGVYRRLHWLDDVEVDDGEGNTVRLRGTLKICSPDEDQNDPEVWVPVSINIEMSFRDGDGGGGHHIRGYRNDAENLVRVVEARRVIHRDTNIDDRVQEIIDNDPTRKSVVFAADEYEFIEDTEDKDQYVETQIMSVSQEQSNEDTTGAGQKDQSFMLNLHNKHLLEFTEEAKGPNNPEHNFDPPWALDPFQNIVNAQWSPMQEVMLAWNAFDIFNPNKGTKRSKNTEDGYEYEDGFGNDVWTAASGLGKTVVVPRPEVIVFGKPSDGDACFMRIKVTDSDFKDIRRGVLNERGELEWTVVKSVSDDGGTTALSFAGGAFFVSSNDSTSRSFMYTSFDGEEWIKSTVAINPNSGEDGSGGQPRGLNVVFKPVPTPEDPDAGIYCHTGLFTRKYQYNIIDIDDGRVSTAHASTDNFWSAVSADGISWAPTYNTSKFISGDSGTPPTPTGTLKSPGLCRPSVAYGAGVFVAASSWPIEYDYYRFLGEINLFRHSYVPIDTCAIATSTDGVTWVNKQLPNVHWDPGNADRAAIIGLDQGIIWCKTSGIDPETKKPKGFFLLSAIERSIKLTGEGALATTSIYHKKRWVSPDGFAWTRAYNSDNPDDGPDRALSLHNKNHGEDIFI